ncbi:hypothetical protein FB451DRAFT_1172076 [Mycena latifolia]|nr:hypothetical protein FB451DRAFT_1172076 [Mycena latifolia]
MEWAAQMRNVRSDQPRVKAPGETVPGADAEPLRARQGYAPRGVCGGEPRRAISCARFPIPRTLAGAASAPNEYGLGPLNAVRKVNFSKDMQVLSVVNPGIRSLIVAATTVFEEYSKSDYRRETEVNVGVERGKLRDSRVGAGPDTRVGRGILQQSMAAEESRQKNLAHWDLLRFSIRLVHLDIPKKSTSLCSINPFSTRQRFPNAESTQLGLSVSE